MNAHNNLIDSSFEILRNIILRGGIGPVIPAIIFLFFFFAMPLVVLCAFGFVSIDRGVVDWTSISLDHLTSTIKDSLFWHFWWRSFWVGTVSTIFCLCLGYPVAYIYTLAGRGWQILILVATISPLLTSALVRTYAWMVILGGRRGVVNSILLDLDFIDRPIRFLYSDFSVILGMTQIHLPFMILPLIHSFIGIEWAINNQLFLNIYIFIVGFLLVSNIPTFSFKQLRIKVSKNNYIYFSIIFFLVLLSLINFLWISISTIGLLYLLSLPISLRVYKFQLSKIIENI